ncbi:hypothetical protein [Arthrobacter ruber]|uniref:hypothetical protein n=1 Tax=Arthrobacter ruber TaxID=1258893 RepID=UPI000CF480E1|nr:hypothetical protein [Arthrobacter ruber]
MTEPSSAGNPGSASLPEDHPLGPAEPVPPLEKEATRAGGAAPHDGGSPGSTGRGLTADRDGSERAGDGVPDGSATGQSDGHPAADRRENVLDPSAGSADRTADGIRQEQGIHSAGAVPAAFDGDSSAEEPGHRRPEDAAAEPDAWDSGGSTS